MVWKAWESSLESKKDENISDSSWRKLHGTHWDGLQGRTDIELNENGIRLAKITGEKLKDVHFDLAIASPLKRAYEDRQNWYWVTEIYRFLRMRE